VVDVGDEAEAQRGVAVVEDQAVGFADGRTQTPANDLHVEHLRFGRAGQDDAAHVKVHPGGHRRDIDDDPDQPCRSRSLIRSRSSRGVIAST